MIHASIYLSLISTMLLLGLVAFWQFYPYKIFTANYQPFNLVDEDKVLKAGDVLAYHSDTCAHFVGEIEINKVLVNNIYIQFTPNTYFIEEERCFDFINESITLPEHLPNGKYHLEIIITSQVNPIRQESVKFITEEFEVRNPVLELNERVEKLEECAGLICPVSP